MEPQTTEPSIEAADIMGKIHGGLEALDAIAAALNRSGDTAAAVAPDALDRAGRVVELLDEARTHRAGKDAAA